MTVKVTTNFNFTLKVKEKLQNIEFKFGRALEDIRSRLEIDADAGKDIEGTQFVKYSDKYSAWRKKEGYQTSPPNLTISGTMLSSMRTDIRKEGANIVGRITVNDDSKKVEGILKKRKFFGLSDKRLAELKKKIGAT
jgi:hypothetical protein